jgi:2,3-bisphosphoglycerate-dependent phosphoglycerate mutase
MALLILVRHGQSVYNLENRFTGSADVALTPLGEQEAKQAGIKLKAYNFDVAYTSVLARAEETLRIILTEINHPEIIIEKSSALNERNYGSLQGLNKAEIAQKYGAVQVEIWRRSYDVCPPGGESLENTYNRVVPYYKTEIEPKLQAGKNILVVAHGNSLRALMMYLENIDHVAISKVNIPTGIPRVYELNENLQVLNVKYLQ